jgi:DNA-directed RNA polymerase subunit N (RpoN/RPB10)
MYLLGLRPVRCLTCGKRFHARYSVTRSRLMVNGKDVGAHG